MIAQEYVAVVCKKGKGAACCRFLMFDGEYQCGKLIPEIAAQVEARRSTMSAKGDNCPGYSEVRYEQR